jgi:phosphotransferase system HPr (HPr) family protein
MGDISMKFTAKVTVTNKLGLHLRAAAELVKVANKFKCSITIKSGIQMVNVKSLMGLMTLAASKGCKLEIITEGEDSKEAVEAIQKIFINRFNEKE